MKAESVLSVSASLYFEYAGVGIIFVDCITCRFDTIIGTNIHCNIKHFSSANLVNFYIIVFRKFYVISIFKFLHYSDVELSAMASRNTGVSIVYSTVCSGADQRQHQSSASLAFVRKIHRLPMNSPHKGPVTRKMFLFDDVIMLSEKNGNIIFYIFLVLNISPRKNYTYIFLRI